ncbi:MAG TPA: pyruvate formate lyase family protein [bacterium]|nr:pyruvate formate lyase family protein [bacterium]
MGDKNISNERIQKLRTRYRREVPRISVQRARFYTESWKSTEGSGDPVSVRRAKAIRNVFENMTIYIDREERIPGSWTEFFLGVPIDVERGVFNDVLAAELDKAKLVHRTLGSSAKFIGYSIGTNRIFDIARNAVNIDDIALPVDFEFRTMDERGVNPYEISPGDRRELLREILPFWRGGTVTERVRKAVAAAGLAPREVSGFMDAAGVSGSRQEISVSPLWSVSGFQGHVVPDYGRVLDVGLEAMKEDVESRLERGDEMPEDDRDFLRSILIALDSVILFSGRLVEELESMLGSEDDPGRRAELELMIENCRRAPVGPAGSFRQAVQAIWTLRVAMQIADPVNELALGRLDQLLFPYYRKDIESGAIGRDEALELISELLLKTMSQNLRTDGGALSDFSLRFKGTEPVTLGGVTRDGGDATNDLTYLFIEAAGVSRAITNVVVRCHKKSPVELYLAVADVLKSGASNISLMSDSTNIEALRRIGVAEPDARDYAIAGCTDVLIPGRTGGLSANNLFLSKVLDVTLRNGDLQTMAGRVKRAGGRTGNPDGFDSFSHLLDAFESQAARAVRAIVKASDIRDAVYARHMPAPFISAFISGCTENALDVTAGGADYDFSLVNMINSLANVVDSLYVIKKLVFDEKRLTVRRLLNAMDDNFKGHKGVYRLVRKVRGRWGSADPGSDEIARDVTGRLFRLLEDRSSFRGGSWVAVMNSMTLHTIDGRMSMATPDGRPAATPFASSCNPYRADGAGLTDVLRSVSSIDFRSVMGCAVNVRMHPSAIGETDESRRKWASLIRTYFLLGGEQIQPTVASAEMLRDAQNSPGEYGDLIVKVGGYSVYFTELGREIQDEIISRTEHTA